MSNLIKITFQDDGKKHERIFEFAPGATCRLAVEQVCRCFVNTSLPFY